MRLLRCKRKSLPNMSALDLKIEKPASTITLEAFHILRDFLQPDSRFTVKEAVRSALALLPNDAQNSDVIWSFGMTCIDIAEQIPYHHPSHMKLAALFEELGKSSKFGSTNSEVCGLLIVTMVPT